MKLLLVLTMSFSVFASQEIEHVDCRVNLVHKSDTNLALLENTSKLLKRAGYLPQLVTLTEDESTIDYANSKLEGGDLYIDGVSQSVATQGCKVEFSILSHIKEQAFIEIKVIKIKVLGLDEEEESNSTQTPFFSIAAPLANVSGSFTSRKVKEGSKLCRKAFRKARKNLPKCVTEVNREE